MHAGARLGRCWWVFLPGLLLLSCSISSFLPSHTHPSGLLSYPPRYFNLDVFLQRLSYASFIPSIPSSILFASPVPFRSLAHPPFLIISRLTLSQTDTFRAAPRATSYSSPTAATVHGAAEGKICLPRHAREGYTASPLVGFVPLASVRGEDVTVDDADVLYELTPPPAPDTGRPVCGGIPCVTCSGGSFRAGFGWLTDRGRRGAHARLGRAAPRGSAQWLGIRIVLDADPDARFGASTHPPTPTGCAAAGRRCWWAHLRLSRRQYRVEGMHSGWVRAATARDVRRVNRDQRPCASAFTSMSPSALPALTGYDYLARPRRDRRKRMSWAGYARVDRGSVERSARRRRLCGYVELRVAASVGERATRCARRARPDPPRVRVDGVCLRLPRTHGEQDVDACRWERGPGMRRTRGRIGRRCGARRACPAPDTAPAAAAEEGLRSDWRRGTRWWGAARCDVDVGAEAEGGRCENVYLMHGARRRRRRRGWAAAGYMGRRTRGAPAPPPLIPDERPAVDGVGADVRVSASAPVEAGLNVRCQAYGEEGRMYPTWATGKPEDMSGGGMKMARRERERKSRVGAEEAYYLARSHAEIVPIFCLAALPSCSRSASFFARTRVVD
ncbi:hypothetical protein DFH06DRAFT_1148871 [Mycena polygramma]|nr:hypothetical protein DFH06DRAFT_1148871 [Mycena polygramma]